MAKKAKAILNLVDGTLIARNVIMGSGRIKEGNTINVMGTDYQVLRLKRPDLADVSLPAADRLDPQCRYIVKAV